MLCVLCPSTCYVCYALLLVHFGVEDEEVRAEKSSGQEGEEEEEREEGEEVVTVKVEEEKVVQLSPK